MLLSLSSTLIQNKKKYNIIGSFSCFCIKHCKNMSRNTCFDSGNWLLFALLLWTGGWTSNWVGQTSTKCCFAKCPLLFGLEQTGANGQSREHLGGLVAKKQPNATSCFQQTVINLSKHKESGSTRSAAQPDDPYLCYLDWCDWYISLSFSLTELTSCKVNN